MPGSGTVGGEEKGKKQVPPFKGRIPVNKRREKNLSKVLVASLQGKRLGKGGKKGHNSSF